MILYKILCLVYSTEGGKAQHEDAHMFLAVVEIASIEEDKRKHKEIGREISIAQTI